MLRESLTIKEQLKLVERNFKQKELVNGVKFLTTSNNFKVFLFNFETGYLQLPLC